MAVNSSRSQNLSLRDGLTDGKYRKARPNTEVAPGAGEEVTSRNRAHLHPDYGYGYVIQQVPLAQEVLPD